MVKFIIEEAYKVGLKATFGLEPSLLEQGKFEKAFQAAIPTFRYRNKEEGDDLISYKVTCGDFHRGDDESTVITDIHGVKHPITSTDVIAYRALPATSSMLQERINFIKTKFAFLGQDTCEEFINLIIKNFNQGGLAYAAMASFACLLPALVPDCSEWTNHQQVDFTATREFGFKAVNDTKVHFNNQFTVLQKKKGILTFKIAFDFVWDPNTKKMTVENVQLQLKPKGKFKDYIIASGKGKELKVINRINIVKYASAGFFALLVGLSAAAAFIAHKQNSKTPSLLLSKALGLGAIIMLCVTVSIYIVQNNFYKKSLAAVELTTTESKERETAYIEKLSFDEKFMLFIQHIKSEIKLPQDTELEEAEKETKTSTRPLPMESEENQDTTPKTTLSEPQALEEQMPHWPNSTNSLNCQTYIFIIAPHA